MTIENLLQLSRPPKGIGVYVRNLSRKFRAKHTPERMVRRLKAAGVRTVAFQAVWQDHQRGHKESNAGVLAPYVRACVDAGMTVGLWGFPQPNRLTEYFTSFKERTAECGGGIGYENGTISFWLHDPEVYWKPQRKAVKGQNPALMRGEFREAVQGQIPVTVADLDMAARWLIGDDLRARREAQVPSVGVTSYGIASWHPIPYGVFLGLAGYTWGSPQLYSTQDALTARGLKEWREFCKVLVPSVPAFGRNSKHHLAKHLRRFEGDDIHGLMVWSYRQIDRLEARTLKAFAEERGWL